MLLTFSTGTENRINIYLNITGLQKASTLVLMGNGSYNSQKVRDKPLAEI